MELVHARSILHSHGDAIDELLDVVTASHAETIRTLKWTIRKLGDASPQLLAR